MSENGAEAWAPVVGHEGCYEVSSRGAVRSLRRVVAHGERTMVVHGRELLPRSTAKGYLKVTLSRGGSARGYFVHVVVLEAFVGVRKGGMVTRHMNGDPRDNRLENLRWGTQVENRADMARHDTVLVGERNHAALLTAQQVLCIRERGDLGESSGSIAGDFGVSSRTIRSVVSRSTWKCLGGQVSDEKPKKKPKRSSTSPTARSLAYCRKRGWYAGVVERRLPHTFTTVDLFGGIDLVAMDDHSGLLGIQATSTPNLAAREKKLAALEEIREWLRRGNRLECWGWAKRGAAGKRKLWTLRRTRARLEQGQILWTEVV